MGNNCLKAEAQDLPENKSSKSQSLQKVDSQFSRDSISKNKSQLNDSNCREIETEVEEIDPNISYNDFHVVSQIGRGGFGKVLLVQSKKDGQFYAMKIIRKDSLSRAHHNYTIQERQILTHIDSPYIVHLHYAFQDQARLYMVMDFIQGGELNQHLRKYYYFNEEQVTIYGAEIVLALEQLHKKKVLYRDLKPKNILVDKDGHLKLTDFGLSKVGLEDEDTTKTKCGTQEYIAPEIILGQPYDKRVDWYSLGIVMYELLHGKTPFKSDNPRQMFEDRLSKPIEIKETCDESTKDILRKLLENNPDERLGCNGIQEIKHHIFFRHINWQKLEAREIKSPFKPRLNDVTDVNNFDPEFTNEDARKLTICNPAEDIPGFNYDKDTNTTIESRSQVKFKEDSEIDTGKIADEGIKKFLSKQDQVEITDIGAEFD